MDQPLSELASALREIRRHAEFHVLAHRVVRNSKEMFRWTEFGDSEKQIVEKFVSGKSLGQGHAFEALYALACAHFERFLRRIVDEYVLAVSSKTKKYDLLNARLKESLLVSTGKTLARLRSNDPRVAQVNPHDLLRPLAGCFPGSEEFTIEGTPISFHVSGFSPRILETILGEVGITHSWDVVGKSPEVRNALGSKTTRETAKLAKSKLGEISQNRNSIVHRGDAQPVIVEADVLELAAFFDGLAAVITETAVQATTK